MSERPLILKKFNSASEFVEWAANAPCKWSGKLSSRRVGRKDWSGTNTFEEAYELALYGWDEGLKKLTTQVNLADKIIAKFSAKQHSYDVAGYRPHIPRAIAGEPLNMIITPYDEIKPKPVVNIRTNFTCNSHVSSGRIMKWGAGICSYIKMLENRGYGTELYAVAESNPSSNKSNKNAPNTSFQFPLKHAENPLSLSNVVFWFAHPAAQRRIKFSASERLDIEKWYGGGYGRAANVTTPAKGTLALSIDDAGDSLEENLEIIRNKHMRVLEEDNPLYEDLAQLGL